MRAALHARYSSDLQNDRSIDDQLALGRAYCGRKGYKVVAVFTERAVSGAFAANRPEYHRLITFALESGCDVIVSEDLDRLSRNQADIATLFERMTFAGVAIDTVADGVINEMHVGLKGTMSALFLKNLALKVHRGMAGVIRGGRHAGARAYGYRPVNGHPGSLAIVEAEADIIRRIFNEYIAGKTPRAIAATLNAEAVPPPRKSHWRASTINGHKGRGTGILQNELYRGQLVWNRVRMVKNPSTGNRISRARPQTEWQRVAVPALRIIDDHTFECAQAMRFERSRIGGGRNNAPKRILSGLLRCGTCGAGMSKKDLDHGRPRIQCTRMRESGTCTNHRAYYLDSIERVVIGGLRDELGTEEAIAYFLRCYNEERRRQGRIGSDRRRTLEQERTDVERQIKRAVAAVVAGRLTDEEADIHLPALRRRRQGLLDEYHELESFHVVKLRPSVLEVYRRDLDRLEDAINGNLARGINAAGNLIRSMIETVTIEAAPAGQLPGIIVRGDLARIVGFEQDSPQRGGDAGSGGGIRTPDTRIMIPLL